MSVKATVVVPTFNHGPLLSRAVGSALAQTVTDLEIFIVGDGATDATRAAAQDLTKQDPRVRFFDNPKGPSRGELSRHAALAEARGHVVCYLSDDDLWFPDHVEVVSLLLQRANFIGAWPIFVATDGTINTMPVNLELAYFREAMVSGRANFFGLSCGAHTLPFYKSLPHGWRTTPAGVFTDLYMWQQCLAQPHCLPLSAPHPTVVTFASPPRAAWTLAERLREMDSWSSTYVAERHALERQLLDVLFKRFATAQSDLSLITNSATWRARGWLANLPVGGAILRQLVRTVARLTVPRSPRPARAKNRAP